MTVRPLEEVGGDSTSRNDSLVIRNSVEHARNAILCRLELKNGSHIPAPGKVKFVDTIRIFYVKTELFINLSRAITNIYKNNKENTIAISAMSDKFEIQIYRRHFIPVF